MQWHLDAIWDGKHAIQYIHPDLIYDIQSDSNIAFDSPGSRLWVIHQKRVWKQQDMCLKHDTFGMVLVKDTLLYSPLSFSSSNCFFFFLFVLKHSLEHSWSSCFMFRVRRRTPINHIVYYELKVKYTSLDWSSGLLDHWKEMTNNKKKSIYSK